MNSEKNNLLYPLACCAVVSVVAFSGIGLAAITGQLSVSPDGEDLFAPSTQQIQQGRDKKSHANSDQLARPTHHGLTRSAINNAGDDEKPMVVRVGQRFSQTLKPACTRCGVIDSIERHELQMPNTKASSGPTFHSATDGSFPTSGIARGKSSVYAPAAGVATSFIVRLRMEDGSVRTIYEHQPPTFSVGEKVQLINGSVVSMS